MDEVRLGHMEFSRATKICLVHSLIFQMGKTEARGAISGLGCATDSWLAGPDIRLPNPVYQSLYI